jgi:hypothetical protein
MAETPQKITVHTGFVTDPAGETTERVADIPVGGRRVCFVTDSAGQTTEKVVHPRG